MMISREEQAMLSEAGTIREERQDASAALVSGVIQRGIKQGKSRGKTRRFAMSTAGTVFAAALVALFALWGPLTGLPKAVPAAPAVSWGSLEPFKEFVSLDVGGMTLESAVRNGYFQIVDQSVEKGGYKIKVDAVAADDRQLTLLYTAEVKNTMELYNVSSVKVSDAVTGDRLDAAGRSGIGKHAEGSKIVYRGMTQVVPGEGAQLPDRLLLDFQISSVDRGKLSDPKTGTILKDMHYSPRLKMTVPLDAKFKANKTEKVYPNQSLKINSHTVTLSEVDISPLSMRAKFTFPEEVNADYNLKNELIGKMTAGGIQSQTAEGAVLLKTTGGHGTDEGYEMVFSSNALDAPESLSLMLMSEDYPKVYTVMADLSKKKIVSTPDHIKDGGKLSFHDKGRILWEQKPSDGKHFIALSQAWDAKGNQIPVQTLRTQLDTSKGLLKEQYQLPPESSKLERVRIVFKDYFILSIK